MNKKTYGWQPDLPDIRDHVYSVVHKSEAKGLPLRVDLSAKLPPVFDQGDLGSCTANALCAAMGYIHPGFIGSRLQVYYGERVIEKDIKTDGGAMIRDGVKVLNKTGVAPEKDWPYVPTNFAKKPDAVAVKDSAQHKVATYSRLTTSADFHNCLAAGFPFVIGFTVYESFESDVVAKSGVVPLPGKNEKTIGGHAVCVYGYDDAKAVYLVRNSWGDAWGQKGNFTIPQSYLNNNNLADDAWTIRN